MAFGITSTTFLLVLSYGPAASSMAVHLAELATSMISGISHLRFGNVDLPALVKVSLPGAVGAFLGAFALSNLDLSEARPWTASLLLILGLLLIYRFSRPQILGKQRHARARWLVPLGFFGGFIDSTGGGGWGPTVTTSLTASQALTPRKAIGTTNTAEFFVAVSASAGFFLGLGPDKLPIGAALALLLGGVLAAPLAAWLVKKAPQRILGLGVGNLIVILNANQILVTIQPTQELTIIVILVCALIPIYSIVKALQNRNFET